jgi:hypothetical protein
MLGVRRVGVAEAHRAYVKVASAMSAAKSMSWDRKALERLVCECYDVVKKDTDRTTAMLDVVRPPINSTAANSVD